MRQVRGQGVARRAGILGLAAFLVAVAVILSPYASANVRSVRSVVVSGPSPFDPGCAPGDVGETNYQNAEVEPRVAVDPRNPNHIVGVWQQDRWTFGGAHGLMAGVSWDGGRTWKRSWATFDRCSGGNAANGGDYERASDPWVTIAPNGDVYQISLSFDLFSPNNAVLVSKSSDGGASWGKPAVVIRDASPFVFNDKESITADPRNARFVYAVWDRFFFDPVTRQFGQPTYFSRTTNGGRSWEPARAIFDGGDGTGTISNQIVVLPDGNLVNMFVFFPAVGPPEIDVIRSRDHGATWSASIKVAEVDTVSVFDPETGSYIRTGDIIPDIAVDMESGKVYVVWQDGRFSGFAHDDIALSVSSNGGRSWSEPIRISQNPRDGPAFTASVAVAEDGTVGVTYYDFRSNTPDPDTLWTDYWLVRCSDSCRNGNRWTSETHLSGPFDLRVAPEAGGLFVGDYEGLAAVGNGFLAFFVKTNTGDLDNRTDVIAARISGEDQSGGHEG